MLLDTDRPTTPKENELAARCAVLVGRMYEMHGWTWGGWTKDRGDAYIPEAEAIAQTIGHLIATDLDAVSTGRLHVQRNDEGDVEVFLSIGWMNGGDGYIDVDNQIDRRNGF